MNFMKQWLSILLAVLLLFTAACCCAEAALPLAETQTQTVRSMPPINLPAVPEDLHTQWQLFVEEPALPVNVTIAEEGENYIITLHDADQWGVAPEGGAVWQYNDPEGWVQLEDAAPALPGAAELHIGKAHYQQVGTLIWSCKSLDETYRCWLEDYASDPAAPEFFLSIGNDDGIITMPPQNTGFIAHSYGDSAASYCVYNAQGMLTLGHYYLEKDNDDYVSYAVIPDESEGGEGYVLYYINVQTAAGDNLLWTEGAWQDIHGNTVDAPKGYDPEELPFELILP